MAEHRYRRVRRSAQPALTAAVSDLEPIKSRGFKNPLSSSSRAAWQIEAWDLLDKVGELRYYVSWRSNSCSKVRLIASELDDDGKPTGKCENQAVIDIVNAIGGNQLGAAEFIKRSVEQLTVPGVTFQGIILGADGRERWLAFSNDEVRQVGTDKTVELPDGSEHVITNNDWLWKCWNPHPRRAKEPDSPVRANLDALREIVTTTRTIADAYKSRLLGAGIVFVPTEMSLPSSTAPTDTDAPGAPIELQGTPAVRELEELLYDVARVSYDDEESFARMIPIFASVAGDQVKNVHHLRFDSELTDVAIKTRNDAIARLALGLDVSPERLLGIGNSTNHWSAWQIGDNDVQMHIAPVMETICASLTEKVLRKMMRDAGMSETEIGKYLVWYDPSELTADPDKSDSATDAFDRGVITADAYREFLNLGATGYDLLNGGPEEWARWAADQVANEPTLVNNLKVLIPAIKDVEFPEAEAIEASTEATKNPPNADTTNEGNDPDTEGEDPGYDQGKRGRKEDVGSRVVDHQAAFVQIFVTRALELVGKRRRNINDRGQKDRLRGLRPHEFHRLMVAVDPVEIPRLMDGTFDTLTDEVLELLGTERGEFENAVRAEVHRQLTQQAITANQ